MIHTSIQAIERSGLQFFLLFILSMFLLVACTKGSPIPLISTAALSSPTSTSNSYASYDLEATQITSPTSAQLITTRPKLTDTLVPTASLHPTPTITPPVRKPFSAHPLVLDKTRASSQLTRLARFGNGTLHDVEWSPNGRHLAVATGLGIYIYDALTLDKISLIDIDDNTTNIAFSPDGKSLAVARENLVDIWDVMSGEKTAEMQGEIEGGVWTLTYGKGGIVAAFGQIMRGLGESVGQLKVWQASTGYQLSKVDLTSGWTNAIDINPDGKTIAYFGEDGLAHRELKSGDILWPVEGNFDVTYSPDGRRLFSTDWDWFDTGENFFCKDVGP